MSDHHVMATNKISGEVLELPTSTQEEVIDAWRIAQEYEKFAKSLKDQLKKMVPKYVSDRGTSTPHKGYMFRISNIQRMTYDKAVLREVFDEDTLDLFLKPDKKKVDEYLRDNLATVGEGSTKLRTTMIAEGNPYQVIKLEKLDREETR